MPNATAPARQLVRYDEVADVLGVSISTVQRLVRSGQLAAVRVAGSPRVRCSDLAAFVAGLGDDPKETDGRDD